MSLENYRNLSLLAENFTKVFFLSASLGYSVMSMPIVTTEVAGSSAPVVVL